MCAASSKAWRMNLTSMPQDSAQIHAYKGSVLTVSSDGAPSLCINGEIIIGTRT